MQHNVDGAGSSQGQRRPRCESFAFYEVGNETLR
jgi:hypothetical protein